MAFEHQCYELVEHQVGARGDEGTVHKESSRGVNIALEVTHQHDIAHGLPTCAHQVLVVYLPA